jgi:hypothetical protein
MLKCEQKKCSKKAYVRINSVFLCKKCHIDKKNKLKIIEILIDKYYLQN